MLGAVRITSIGDTVGLALEADGIRHAARSRQDHLLTRFIQAETIGPTRVEVVFIKYCESECRSADEIRIFEKHAYEETKKAS